MRKAYNLTKNDVEELIRNHIETLKGEKVEKIIFRVKSGSNEWGQFSSPYLEEVVVTLKEGN